MTCWFREPKKKVNRVCRTINSRGSFMFSLFWLSYGGFLRIYCQHCPKLQILWVSSSYCPSGQYGPIFPAWVANQNTGFPAYISHRRCQPCCITFIKRTGKKDIFVNEKKIACNQVILNIFNFVHNKKWIQPVKLHTINSR